MIYEPSNKTVQIESTLVYSRPRRWKRKRPIELWRLIPNNMVLKAATGTTVGKSIDSVILYAISNWKRALKFAKYREMIKKVRPRVALLICRAFKTISMGLEIVILSVLPIDILAVDRIKRYFNLKQVFTGEAT